MIRNLVRWQKYEVLFLAILNKCASLLPPLLYTSMIGMMLGDESGLEGLLNVYQSIWGQQNMLKTQLICVKWPTESLSIPCEPCFNGKIFCTMSLINS